MAVVPTEAAYIVANYKEMQLADVRPGQAVELAVDMFPNVRRTRPLYPVLRPSVRAPSGRPTGPT